MTPLQLELTRLIGKKELTFGCLLKLNGVDDYMSTYMEGEDEIISTYEDGDIPRKFIKEMIGHPATLDCLHKWIMKTHDFQQTSDHIEIVSGGNILEIKYDSSKPLLEQSEDTLQEIITLVKNNS